MRKNSKKIIKAPVLSLNAKVEQTAKLLRKETRKQFCLSLPERSFGKKEEVLSATNTIQQIAKKLREQVHLVKRKKHAA